MAARAQVLLALLLLAIGGVAFWLLERPVQAPPVLATETVPSPLPASPIPPPLPEFRQSSPDLAIRSPKVLAAPEPAASPAKIISTYPGLPLEDRLFALRYLDPAESWTEPDRAALLALTLRDPKPEMRMAAVLQSQSGFFPTALPLLEHALTDSSPEVRTLAVDAIAASGDQRAAAALEKVLVSPDSELRLLALDAAGQLDREARRPLLLRALELPDDALAENAINAVWDAMSPEMILPVMRQLDATANTRQEAAREFLDAIFGVRFDTRRNAELWWDANRQRYQEVLTEK